MTDEQRGQFCCTTGGALGFWFAIFALAWGGLLLLRQIIPAMGPYSASLLFTAAGVACVANFARNRTFHCLITGPFFLLVAGVLALGAAGLWEVSTGVVWPLVLITVGVAFLLERRYAT